MCEKMIFLKNIKNQPYACTVSKDELKRMSEPGERSLFRAKKNVADRRLTVTRTLRTVSCKLCTRFRFRPNSIPRSDSCFSFLVQHGNVSLFIKWLASINAIIFVMGETRWDLVDDWILNYPARGGERVRILLMIHKRIFKLVFPFIVHVIYDSNILYRIL